MGFGFWKNLGKNKVADAGRALQDAIVRFDPEGASEAAIAEMEENFDKINIEFSRAKQEWQREQREADEIVETYNKRLAAAELLQGQVEAGGTGSRNAERGLTELLEALEDMAGDVEIEQQEAEDAKLLMDDLQETVNLYADKLKTSRRDMKKAANSLERAQAKEQRAKAQADRAAEMAGIRNSATGLSSALESLNRQAEDANAKADASVRKSELLGTAKVEENSAVADALATVSGEDTSPKTAADRLAALKRK
jgi:chromosome segregation ATPase